MCGLDLIKLVKGIIKDRKLARFLMEKKFMDDSVIIEIIRNFGDIGIIALKNFGKHYSRCYECIIKDENNKIYVYTFLGRNAEYIIFPYAGYCGCFSKYPINITRRYPCYHLLTFLLDSIVGNIIKYKYEFENYESFKFDFLLESLNKNI